MLRELHDDEILVRYFKRPAEARNNAEHVLWPTDFERRRKPAEALDENGISLSRLIINPEGSKQLPPRLKTILSKETVK
jgi:hypothetical protein